MCMTDLQETIDRMESLRQQLVEAKRACDNEDYGTYEKLFKEMQPDLLFVSQSLLGVVVLREEKTPYGNPMPVVDHVDEDALNCTFM